MKLFFYADDAGFIFGSREQLIEGSKIIYEVFQEFGLKMHLKFDGKKSKSEAMYFPGVDVLPGGQEGVTLERAEG